jgi:uncharacterized oxidoreductase
MKLSGNTILVTGGGSGIGRGLAEAFQALGNRIIIAGRRQQKLDEVVAANPGMSSLALDIEDPIAIRAFAAELIRRHRSVNVVINNAGIMPTENLLAAQVDLTAAEATVATNLLGPIRLTSALLPHLRMQQEAAILMVSSGLGFVPLALNPTYCATKAAIHSYTQSLRYQLQHTAVEVVEIVPPYVQTELGGARQANDPHAMPLQDFITETMTLIKSTPAPTEICVERVKPLRWAERGDYAKTFQNLNDTLTAARAGELR